MWTVYDVFKKAHKQLAFPYPPDWYPRTPAKPSK
jgi:hypothetical protein